MSIKTIITQLRLITGRNDKSALIKRNQDYPNLKEFFRLALDRRIKFGILRVPPYERDVSCTITFAEAMEGLETLATGSISGCIIDYVSKLLSSLEQDDAEMLELIITKTISCGVDITSVNKVYGTTFIRKKAYMRCDLATPENCANINTPLLIEWKMDGKYADFYTNTQAQTLIVESRDGIPSNFLGSFDESFLALAAIIQRDHPEIINPIFSGELLSQDSDGNVSLRQVGNGIASKAANTNDSISIEEADQMYAVIWDIIPASNHLVGVWKEPRISRLKMVQAAIDELGSHRIKCVEYHVMDTLEDAFIRSSGVQHEGTDGWIMKDMQAIWKSGTSKGQLKIKTKFASDYKAVGIIEGAGKFKNMMGSILFETSDGKLTGSVGTGWKVISIDPNHKEYRRKYIWDNWETLFKGRILTICGNDITIAKDSSTYALSHPSIDLLVGGWRDPDEKTEADSYEKVRAELESARYIIKKTE